MAKLSQSASPLLAIPSEILAMICEELITDPTSDPYLVYQFFFHTCHHITSATHHFKPLWSGRLNFQRTVEQYIDDWRTEFLDAVLYDMEPLALNLVDKLSIEGTGWDDYPDLDFEDEEDTEYLKVDENDCRFWEVYDEGHFWLLKVLEKFPGVDKVDLLSCESGFFWDLESLVREIQNDGDMGWKIVECNREDHTFELVSEKIYLSAEPSNWLHRKRSVVVWVN